MLPRLELPPSRALLVLLGLAFALPGLVGHDPWKTFDAVTIEIVSQMHRSGDWLVPSIAGEPWLEDPPFFHWIALAFTRILGWALPFHGAARMASALFMFLALWFLYLAARHAAPEEERRDAASTAVLVTGGALGLFIHAHEAVPDLATLAASCAAFAALSQAARRPLAAGIAFGITLGIAFLSTGPVAPAVIALAALAAHFACPDWRTRRMAPFLGAAAACFALLAASWPLALARRSPELAAHWWALVTQPRGAFLANLRFYVVTASWFAWPAWPLAAWGLWARRERLLEPRMFVPLAALIAALLAISFAGPAQDINAMLLLPPLALLAAQGVSSLRRGAANSLDWFGVMTFTSFAALIWLGYVAMVAGVPPRIAHNAAKLAPGFSLAFEPLPFLYAAALTLAWLYLAFFTAPAPTRGVLRWAAGVALLWGCVAMLWMPWVDHQRSYRSVALQLKSKIAPGAPCVAGSSLGITQRAALSYHAAIQTRAFDRSRPNACPFVLVQGSPRNELGAPGPGWVKLADVGRPGDKSERYRLYQRAP